MSQPLNTFVVILLAFPFYLAQKGRLAAFVDFAKPAKTGATAAPGQASTASAAPAAASGAAVAENAASTYTTFADAAALFS
jgi:hypothetical protein